MDGEADGNGHARGRRPPSKALLFARNFVRHPTMLGVPLPSSRFLIRRLLGHGHWERAKVVVEYGPGVGTFTTEILRRMPPDGRLLAIETNRDFVDYLERWVDDPRLDVVHGSAERVGELMEERGLARADYVVSGVPFGTLPPSVRDRIVRATRDVLAPDGAFLVYQFLPTALSYLRGEFREVTEDREALNLVPMRIYECRP